MNKYQTYSLLGRVLALDSLPSHKDSIIASIQNNNIRWEGFVNLADHHLVLQALYPKIRDHKLEDFFPEEVVNHLKYIFELSTQRNLEVILQSDRLTAVLRQNGITPLYMKGVGNILDGIHKYPGERILHDIDILVSEESYELAAETLLNDGYKSNSTYNPEHKSKHRHYPILYKAGEPVYVELHWMPVGKSFSKYFNTKMVFDRAIPPASRADCLVMSDEHKIIHNFMHAQLDHMSRFYAREFMRNLYDLHLLSKRANPEQVFTDFDHFRRASSGYLDICYDSLGIIPNKRKIPAFFLHSYRKRYYLNLRYRFIGISSLFIIRAFLGYVVKPLKAINDEELRGRLISDLGSREWYNKQGRYYKRLFGFTGKKN